MKSCSERVRLRSRAWWLAMVVAGSHVSGAHEVAADDVDDHWAFRPISTPRVPDTPGESAIDRFVARRLLTHRLAPSQEAPAEVLVRRVTLDLVGLLPSPERVRAFVQERRPDRWERLVDELLASPHFGERWGRHWLDLARFSDSSGYEADQPRQIWPYRDWVIRALNDDMEFGQFVTEQLAGDLLPGSTLQQKIATGFQCNVMYDPGVRYEAVVDQVQTVGAVFLGLTLGCAQCHAHKTDPISHEDFYGLYAFFNETSMERLPLPGFDTGYRDGRILNEEQKKTAPRGPATVVLRASPQPTRVFEQGDPSQPGDVVKTAIPVFFDQASREGDTGADPAQMMTRLDLAAWIVSEENPLFDRVTVNRVWQRLFGRGLVLTANDFGVQTPPPSHPDLLDHLAMEFRGSGRSGRSIKRLIRSIVLSAVYRRSSDQRPDLLATDASNRWLARQNRLRLESEVIRDVSLQAGGLLSTKMHGPSVFPRQSQGVLTARATPATWELSVGEDQWRRGLYTWNWRLTPHPLGPLFDSPDGVAACTRRDRSNVPVQALALLNDASFYRAAVGLGAWAQRQPGENASRLRALFARCLGRRASVEETRVLGETLKSFQASWESDPEAARDVLGGLRDGDEVVGATLVEFASWVLVARVVLNLDEFITRE